MLVVDLYALQTVDALDLIDDVVSDVADSAEAEDVLG